MRLVGRSGPDRVAAEVGFQWQPHRIGPRFQWLDHEHIQILEGELEGRQFRLRTAMLDTNASAQLTQEGRKVGHVFIDRDPPGTGIVLWDIVVRKDLRHKGLASIMTWCVFRELLEHQSTATFRIRMITSVRPGEQFTELQNLGICVIANRLGFTTDFDLDDLLKDNNVSSVVLVPPHNGAPPGLKVMVRSYPLVLMALAMDRDTGKPIRDMRTYTHLVGSRHEVRDWARDGLIVASNGNFSLRSEGIGRFVNGIAVDEDEAREFLLRIHGV